MVARLTAAEAKAIGITTATDGPGQRAGGGRSRTTRKAAARAGARSTCATCGAVFTRDADETRHVNDHAGRPGHARYESDVTSATPCWVIGCRGIGRHRIGYTDDGRPITVCNRHAHESELPPCQ